MDSAPPLTIHASADALEAGHTTAVELTEMVLARVETTDQRIGAYLHVDAAPALAAAAEADARRSAGRCKSRFDGVPIAIKDNMAAVGQPCTCGSKILMHYTSPYNATAVQKLLDAGFVLLGRTNMDEFAMGSSTEHSGFKPTANPWDAERVPGGSSGGSAAAVAAGEAVAALGSDTGGSIRQPAGFCGVVGLKPTYGRVSRYGLVAYASSLDQIGPISRDTRDAAILLSAISGHDPMDSTSLSGTVPDFEQGIGNADATGLRIGMPREYFEVEGLDSEVRAGIEAAARTYEEMGATLVDVRLPHTQYAVAAYYIIATAEASANLARFDGIRYGNRDRDGEAENLLATYRKTRGNGFGEEVKRRIILGTYVLSSGYYDAYYLRAQKVRTLIRQDFREAFEQCDLILSPVAPTAAFRAGEITDPLQMYLADIYTLSCNLAGICGISVPCGLNSDGMPIGMQLLGPALGESTLLGAASAFERTSPFTACPPSVG